MLVSGNGWPVSPKPEDLDIVPFEVGGTVFAPGVRGGKVHEVLHYVASQVHNRVQRANEIYGCWGYSYRENVNSPGTWSNHASGTAIDFNATKHPNGSPTAANWTAAQIAEIHKILDEVDNVVRWGGDYTSTPDAMHFEIDVPPEQLEGRSFPKSSTVLPVGVPSYGDVPAEQMPELTPMSVGYPTLMSYGGGDAWWIFKPTRSGRISIDALMSHWVDEDLRAESEGGPAVTLEIRPAEVQSNGRYEVVSWWDYVSSSSYAGTLPSGPPPRNQGRILMNSVVAGQAYLIRTVADPGYPFIRTVVRIGDWAPEPEWEQPPDVTHEYTAPPEKGGNRVSPTGKYIDTAGSGFVGGALDFNRAFYSTAPGLQQDAIDCLWRWSRRSWLNGYNYWWSPGNVGDANPGDPGTCPNLSGVFDQNSTGGTTVGHWYSSSGYDTFWGYQDITCRTFAAGQSRNIHLMSRWLKRNGHGHDHGSVAERESVLPDWQSGEWLEWESDYNTIINAWWSFDELNGGGTAHNGGLVAKWYVHNCEELGERGPGTWGPRNPPVETYPEDSYYKSIGINGVKWAYNPAWYGQGAQAPEDFYAGERHLGDTTGGYSNWAPLPEDLWYVPILFTCIPADMFSDSPPTDWVPGDPALYVENYRTGQFIAIKLTVRPPRIRVFRDPGINHMPWEGVNAIDVAPAGQGAVLY